MTRKILLLTLSIFFIVLGFSTATLAAEDVEWVQEIDSKKLFWGGSVEVGGYLIKAEDFSENKIVYISLSKDGEEVKSAPLSVNSNTDLEYNDEIKVHAKSIAYEYTKSVEDDPFRKSGVPYAEICVYLRGKPGFDIKIETDKDSYDPKALSDREITAKITLKNDGKAKAENVGLVIDTGGLKLLDGKLNHQYLSIQKDESMAPFTLRLAVPAPWEKTTYKISAQAIGFDIKGKKFEENNSKSIDIQKKWGLVVSKSATKDRHMGETVYVSVTVRNDGLCSIDNIKVTDSVLSDMKMKEETELEKTLSLAPGETAANVFKYSLLPEKPGAFTLPKAEAAFTLANGQDEKISSDSEPITIYGPNIELTKTLDRLQVEPGDKLTVTVTAKNTGNVDASVHLTDTVPKEAKFISGDLSFDEVLSSGESKEIKYVLLMHTPGNIQLPACTAAFLDLDDYKGEVKSKLPSSVFVGIAQETGNPSGVAKAAEGDKNPQGASNSGTEEGPDTDVTKETQEGPEEDIPGFGTLLALLMLCGSSWAFKKRRN